ncbi:MAG: NRDE family protein, partial [Silanimonas sp.]
MCLIAFAVDAHPRWRFVLAGNRDEFHARPTAAAGFLDAEEVTYGGRDLQAGGGWLQVDRRGRVAAVTNVRLGRAESAPRSRGALVADFIAGDATAAGYVDVLGPIAADYGRFNLLLWDSAAHYASNHPAHRAVTLSSGLHALSNADLDTPWPKTEALRAAMARWLAAADRRTPREGGDLLEPLFAALADPTEAPDAVLPDTGVGLEWERRL